MFFQNEIQEFYILGLKFLGTTTYDPSSPNRFYFTIGHAISALALILALYQLLRTITKFRLKVSSINSFIIYFIFSFAIISVFLAAILPIIPGQAIPVISYPVFWEILAGVLFVIGFVLFLLIIYSQSHFNSKNHKEYFKACTSVISKGNDKDLRDLAEEISGSIKEVIITSKEYNQNKYYISQKEKTDYSISEYAEYALSLLDVWSDEKFCQIIVCNVPSTAIELFRQIEEQKFYDSGGYALVNQLVHQAFINKSSILHREKDYTGLGHFKTFTNLVFGNSNFIESHFRPLQAWHFLDDENVEIWKVEKYLNSIKVALEAYLCTPSRHHSFQSGLYCAFLNFEMIISNNCMKLDKISESEVYESLHFKVISRAERWLKDILKIIKYKDKRLSS